MARYWPHSSSVQLSAPDEEAKNGNKRGRLGQQDLRDHNQRALAHLVGGLSLHSPRNNGSFTATFRSYIFFRPPPSSTFWTSASPSGLGVHRPATYNFIWSHQIANADVVKGMAVLIGPVVLLRAPILLQNPQRKRRASPSRSRTSHRSARHCSTNPAGRIFPWIQAAFDQEVQSQEPHSSAHPP